MTVKPKAAVRDRHRHEGTEAQQTVRRVSGKDQVERDDVRKIPIDHVQELPHVAKVRVEGSVTKNLGDFNSVRIGVAVEWPCAPTEKAVAETYKFLSDKVDTMISEELRIAVG